MPLKIVKKNHHCARAKNAENVAKTYEIIKRMMVCEETLENFKSSIVTDVNHITSFYVIYLDISYYVLCLLCFDYTLYRC